MTRLDLDPVDVLARRLVRYEPSPHTAASMRAGLVQAAAKRSLHGRRWRAPIVASMAVCAAAAIIVLLVRAALVDGTTATEPAYRGRIIASDGAMYRREGTPGHEVVHVSDGVMRFEVTPLMAGEHFHVVVGDHRVEVRGTIFHVTARHHRLVSVAVARGRVDVIAPNRDVTRLAVGDSWPIAPADVEPTIETAITPPIAGPAASSSIPAASSVTSAPAAGHKPVVPARPRPPADRDDSASEAAPAATRAPWPGESEFRDGWFAYQRGDYGQAAQRLRTSCRDAREGTIAEDACFWYAVALDRGGQSDAIAAYRSFLQRWPAARRSDEARVQLAALLARAGDRDAARDLLREAGDAERATTREAAHRALRDLEGKR